jgi:hypothetical protein
VFASPVLAELYRRWRQLNQPRDKTLLLLHEPFIEQSDMVFSSMLCLLESLDPTWSVRLRPHPAYTGDLRAFLRRIQAGLSPRARNLQLIVEDPRKVTPTESLSRQRVVASCVSTMLLEGWLAGCKLVYFSGVMADSFIIERYQSSPNVMIVSPSTPQQIIRDFVNVPAILDALEVSRVRHIMEVGPIAQSY